MLTPMELQMCKNGFPDDMSRAGCMTFVMYIQAGSRYSPAELSGSGGMQPGQVILASHLQAHAKQKACATPALLMDPEADDNFPIRVAIWPASLMKNMAVILAAWTIQASPGAQAVGDREEHRSASVDDPPLCTTPYSPVGKPSRP